uniref:Mitochondrial 2-oxoglutarate/malate carrier protein n=1 Tax=Tabanus bromius TaxID=304241 RepID=A0A0K8TSR4_TABBR
MSEAPKKTSSAIKFLLGGLSGVGATCIVQPLDLVKTRMQVSGVGGGVKEYKNSLHCIATVVKNEGPLALYNGLGAAILRQATYTTTSLKVKNECFRKIGKRQANVFSRMAMGASAGAVAALVGTPAEIALIRMTADGRLPLAERRNYTGVFNALARMTREEGILTLWRGCIPTIGRAMVVNMAQLASYSQAKSSLVTTFKMQEGFNLHLVASIISGFITTVASMPVDMAKTRIQNMKIVDGKPEYRGTIDVLMRVARHEGVFALWKGFTPYFCRLGPHTVLTFIFVEQLNKFYSLYVLGQVGGTSGL